MRPGRLTAELSPLPSNIHFRMSMFKIIGWPKQCAAPTLGIVLSNLLKLMAVPLLISVYGVFSATLAYGTDKTGKTDAAAVKTIHFWTHAAVDSGEYAGLKLSAYRYNAGRHGYRVEVWPAAVRGYDEQVSSAALAGSLPC